jgi:hypothetical protein
VLCGCEEKPSSRIIAWIDDLRPDAEHVFIESNTGYTKALRNSQSAAGAWHSYGIGCRACQRHMNLSEATADEIIDKLIPIRNTLEIQPIPSLDQPDRRSDEQRAADLIRARKLLDDQLHGRGTPIQSEPHAGPFEVYENRYVIPFDLLDPMVKEMRSRERS